MLVTGSRASEMSGNATTRYICKTMRGMTTNLGSTGALGDIGTHWGNIRVHLRLWG